MLKHLCLKVAKVLIFSLDNGIWLFTIVMQIMPQFGHLAFTTFYPHLSVKITLHNHMYLLHVTFFYLTIVGLVLKDFLDNCDVLADSDTTFLLISMRGIP